MRTEDSVSPKVLCANDTDGDGDCHLCANRHGCPFSVFARSQIDRSRMTEEQVMEFKKNSEEFVYREFGGVIRGYRNHDGHVLIEQVQPWYEDNT